MTKFPTEPAEVLAEALTASLPVFAKVQMAHQCISALRAAGWIIVRDDAIRLAQAHARQEVDDDVETWRSIAFKRGELLDEVGPQVWGPDADRIAANDNRPALPIAGNFG